MLKTPTEHSTSPAAPARRQWWRWLRAGSFWMAVQAALVAAYHLARPGFELIRRNDSLLYIELARRASPLELLGSIRTPGYPLLLRAVDRLGGGLEQLPAIQLVLYLLAAVGLCAALERFGLSPLGAFVGASPLLYSPLVPNMAPSAMTDIPAAAMAIGCSALLLAAITATDRPVAARSPDWTAALVAVGLSCCWLLRPSYVFLVVFLPLAALWLPPVSGGTAVPAAAEGAGPWRRRAHPRRRRLALRLAILALLPLVAYSALRWLQVGHFAPASFSGHSLAGTAASLVHPERIDELPAEHRGMARWVIAQRPRRSITQIDAGSPFENWERDHVKNSWRIAVHYARRQWEALPVGEDGRRAGRMSKSVWVDRYLASWSQALIRSRPGLFTVWLLRAAAAALARTLANPWIWAPGVALLLGVLLRRRRRLGAARLPRSAQAARAFLVFTAGYYLVSLAVVLPMQPPRWRYMAAATLLLPGGLAALAVELLRRRYPEATRTASRS